MENVIQIIDPADNSNDEEPCNISFSLPNELESAKTLDGQICYNTHRAVGSVKGTRLIKTVESVDSVEFPETAQATKAMSYEFHTSNSDIDTCRLLKLLILTVDTLLEENIYNS